MAIDIGELRGILTLQDQFSGPVNSAAKQLSLFGESFGAVTKAAGLAAGAVAAATGAIVALGVRGTEVSEVADGFDDLSRRCGSTAEVMLGALSRGVKGTISDFDLMKLANSTLGGGMVKSAEDMHTMAAGAKLLGDRVGVSTKEAFETLTKSMATGRTAGLKQLSLFVDTKGAVDDYKDSLAGGAGAMSDLDKKTVSAQAILAALKREVDAAGDTTRNFADNIDAGKAMVQNFADSLGVAIAKSPVLQAGMQAVGQALQSAFGGTQQSTIQTLIGFVNQFAIGLTYVAQGAAVAATVVVSAWYGIKTAILAVLTVFVGVGTAIVALVAGFAEMGTKIPIVGQHVKGFAEGSKALAQGLAAATVELGRETAEAAKGAVGQSQLQAAIDKAHGAVLNIRTAMVAAQGAQAALTAGARGLKNGLDDVDKASKLTAAEIKAMQEATWRAANAMVATNNMIGEAFDKLQEELALANKTGLDRRLAEIQLAQQKELAGYQYIAFVAPATYDLIAAAVKEKYGKMSADAVQSFTDQATAAVNSGETQLQAAQRTLDKARANYRELLASGKATYEQLAQARAAAAKAEEDVEREKTKATLMMYSDLASSASSIIKSLFGKNKAAAIAAVLLDTAAAVMRAFATLPPPASWAAAAVAVATGAAQMAKIKSTNLSYAKGVPETAFMDYGRGASATLHGEETVVTKAQGKTLAEKVLEAARGGAGAREVVIHNVLNLDGRKVAENTVRHMPRVLALAGVR